jgi:uncharacterized protein HemX
MKEWFLENIFTIITALFGGGSFWAYLTEKKKRKIEEKSLATDALKSMQDAYDRFTEDSKQRYDDLKLEIEDLKKRLSEVTKQLQEERNKYNLLIAKERKKYDELQQQLDECIESQNQ